MTKGSELKPCPFCGSAKLIMDSDWCEFADRTFRSIKCKDCGAASGRKSHAKGDDCPNFYAEVREKWNRRELNKGAE